MEIVAATRKTTIDISGPLLEKAKRIAARESTTLRELVEARMRHLIQAQGRSWSPEAATRAR